MTLEVDYGGEPWLEMVESPGSPTGVPQVYSVSIGGRTYIVNTSFEPYRRDAFRHRSIQAQRESIDLTNIPGEGTVNTEGLWRRSADDWHFGAGQPYQDRKGSVDARFSTSKGVNPWMQWQCELLNDTKQVKSLAGGGQVLNVGSYVYLVDWATNTLYYTSDYNTWNTVSGISGTIGQLATDGYNVWMACNSGGVYTTTAGSGTASNYNTGNATNVWWVGERLMVTNGNNVYNPITSGALPAALWTHPDPNFVFTDMAQGSSQIYMAGYDNSTSVPTNSVVYRSTIEATGTALTIPVQALPLEGGEYCTSLYGYLNFIFVGTNLGIRMCRTLAAYDPTGNQGDLEAGPLFPGLFPPGPLTGVPNQMVGNNRFIYFPWTNYDTVSTGIGRADLSTFIDTQAPAFTSDLMVTGQGIIESLDWSNINSAPIFVVNGLGVYTDSGSPVSSGYVESGLIEYGISDDKILWAGDIGSVTPQQGTITMGVSTDGSTFANVGAQQSAANGGSPVQSPFAINQTRGNLFTTKMTLSADSVTGETPIMHRWTLKALPAITAGTTISVVILLYGTVDNRGQDLFFDQYAELEILENWRTTQTVVEYVEGPYSAMCVVDEIDWLPFKESDANPEGGYGGDCIVYLKTVDIGA